MVIYGYSEGGIEYEIKHSAQMTGYQVCNLVNEDWMKQTQWRFGEIMKRCVLYRGEDSMDENGIEYCNVERYLAKKGS